MAKNPIGALALYKPVQKLYLFLLDQGDHEVVLTVKVEDSAQSAPVAFIAGEDTEVSRGMARAMAQRLADIYGEAIKLISLDGRREEGSFAPLPGPARPAGAAA